MGSMFMTIAAIVMKYHLDRLVSSPQRQAKNHHPIITRYWQNQVGIEGTRQIIFTETENASYQITLWLIIL